MDKVIAQRWVDALRSGKYEQETGALQKNSGFCCLGVLCDLAVKDGVIPEPVFNEETEHYEFGNDSENKVSELPPASVENWSGLDPETEYAIDGLFYHETLYNLNDSKRMTFAEIADVIEREYL